MRGRREKEERKIERRKGRKKRNKLRNEKMERKIHMYMYIMLGNVSCFSITFPSNRVCHCLGMQFSWISEVYESS